MILDGILLVLQGILNVILLPVTALNVGIDLISSIPIVTQFLQLIAYILPWDNLLPIFIFVIGLFVFRIGISLAKLVVHFIPFY